MALCQLVLVKNITINKIIESKLFFKKDQVAFIFKMFCVIKIIFLKYRKRLQGIEITFLKA